MSNRSNPLAVRGFAMPAVSLLSLLAFAGCASDSEALPETEASSEVAMSGTGASAGLNALSAEEQAEGWRLLFDGESFNGWRGLGSDSIPSAHWTIEEGTIKKIPSGDVPVQADGQPTAGGDLMTVEAFDNFELAFEWKISEGGNSGIKYNVSEELSTAHPPRSAALGFEYQILDDDRHPDANAGVDGNRKAAGLYDLMGPPADKPLRAPGEWNEGRIIFQGNHGEHWLNGEKVIEYELGSPQMDSLLAASKYDVIDGFADRRTGHIVLQDHNDAAWFRNIKIRQLD